MAKKLQISEKRLHAFWQKSRYFTRLLLTSSKHQIEIIHRGKYNRDAGPDFIGAVVKIDNKLYRGDVEIHVNARDWFAHGHHTDPAYNQVILHVALELGAKQNELTCENGREILQLFVPADELALAKSSAPIQNESLALAFCPLAKRKWAKRTRTVYAAGRMRLNEKTARMRELIDTISWDQLLYRGLCEALGYSKNQKPFLQLAELVPIDLIFNELHHRRIESPRVVISALLFGAAGLLKPAEAGECDAEIRAYLAPRHILWQHLQHTLQIQPMPEAAWQFFRLRPQNFPTRRIAALVELIQKFYGNGMLEMLVGLFSAGSAKAGETIKALRHVFTVAPSGFWLHYYDFRSRLTPHTFQQTGALLGDKTADAMIVNVVLPIIQLFAKETASASLSNSVAEVYSAFPKLQSNQITRKMQQQLFAGAAEVYTVPGGSEFQQGLIHLHKNYCASLKCEACLNLAKDCPS